MANAATTPHRSGSTSGDPLPDPVAIEAVGITKAYGANLVLDGVDFQVFVGKVNVLLGENGAGKSTMMKIFAGEIAPDSGHIARAGKILRFRSPRDAQQHGVALIHQELSLFPALTVADNIFAGRELRRAGLVDDRRQIARARAILTQLDPRIDPNAPVGNLAVGQQQVIEIAKALVADARVVIMDEPTSALSNSEVDALFDIIQDLKRRQVAVIYISHRMDEIFRIGDHLVVLRDGRRVAAAAASDVDMNWISDNMLGSQQREALQGLTKSRRPSGRAGPVVLKVEGLSLANAGTERLLLNNVSLELRGGEILGLYGLLGAGKTEIAESIAGLRSEAVGCCSLCGVPVAPTPAARIEAGLAFVPEDRQRQALVPTATVGENITLSSLGAYAVLGVVITLREARAVWRSIAELAIKVKAVGQSVLSLSGGNQQKAIIARALLTVPKALILDEPTRGIDVGAKAEIFKLMRRLADEGLAVLFSSSELPEILAVSDRVIVLSRGEIRAVFEGPHLNEGDIIRASVNDTPV